MKRTPMSRARLQQENRAMRFTEAYDGWVEGRLTQVEADLMRGTSERNFRRHIDCYKADGLSSLLDKRLLQISFAGWNINAWMREKAVNGLLVFFQSS